MQVISQVRLSTFDGGKTFNGEVKIGDTFVNLTADALRALLAEHKRIGGTVRKFPSRSVVIKNADRAARYGRKAGEAITVTDYATDRMRFDITIGDNIADDPKNITLVNDFSVSADSLDLGEVKEVQAKPKTAPVSSQTAEADELG